MSRFTPNSWRSSLHQKLPKSPRGQTSRSWDVIWDRFRHRPSQRNFPAKYKTERCSLSRRGKVGTFFLAYILISSSTHPDLNERLIRGAPKRRAQLPVPLRTLSLQAGAYTKPLSQDELYFYLRWHSKGPR
eukprot:scaffold1249_cov127-Skeletonema_menzelii.AAC.1